MCPATQKARLGRSEFAPSGQEEELFEEFYGCYYEDLRAGSLHRRCHCLLVGSVSWARVFAASLLSSVAKLGT